MPTIGDIALFLKGQAFGHPTIPSDADLAGKTILVTGANSGLGLDACKHLARMNVSRLIIGCRNMAKGEEARQAVLEESGRNDMLVEVWEVDLDRYSSVVAFTARVRKAGVLERLDAVVANAGVELASFDTSEGLERTLTVNVVSTYLLCLGVLPKLEETARTYGVPTKLTLVGSLIHNFGDHAQLHNKSESRQVLQALSDPNTAQMGGRYALSKLLQHLCFTQFSRSCTGSEVIINLVNPGWCGTGLSRNKEISFFERSSFSVLGRTSEMGSRTLVHAVCAGSETNGVYLSECHEQRQSTYVTSREGQEMAARVWREVLAVVERSDPVAAKALV